MSLLVWPLILIAVLGRPILGLHYSTTRIIGGSSVDIKQAPHQANIIVDGNPYCSGAIIGSKSILTAAGCVYGCPPSSVRVRVGSSSREGGGTLATVCGIKTHPQYSSDRYDNNLAVLELCEPLNFTDSIKAINVTDKMPDESSLAEVTGWGSTSWLGSWWDRTFGSLPDQLQAATVSFYNKEQCAYDLSSWFWVWDYGVSDLTLCTYSYNKAACSYDTGAPLVKDKKLVGILSYGGCTTYPDVYANLFKFRTWLCEMIADTAKTTTKAPISAASTTKTSNTTTPASSTATSTSMSTTFKSNNTTRPNDTTRSTTSVPTTSKSNGPMMPNNTSNTNDSMMPNNSSNTNDPMMPNNSFNTNDPVMPNNSSNSNDLMMPNNSSNTNDLMMPNNSSNNNDPMMPNNPSNNSDNS